MAKNKAKAKGTKAYIRGDLVYNQPIEILSEKERKKLLKRFMKTMALIDGRVG
jgi:hypothetical protein